MNEGKFYCCYIFLCYYEDICVEVFDEIMNGFDFVVICIFIILLFNFGQLLVILIYVCLVLNFKLVMCDVCDCFDVKYYQV